MLQRFFTIQYYHHLQSLFVSKLRCTQQDARRRQQTHCRRAVARRHHLNSAHHLEISPTSVPLHSTRFLERAEELTLAPRLAEANSSRRGKGCNATMTHLPNTVSRPPALRLKDAAAIIVHQKCKAIMPCHLNCSATSCLQWTRLRRSSRHRKHCSFSRCQQQHCHWKTTDKRRQKRLQTWRSAALGIIMSLKLSDSLPRFPAKSTPDENAFSPEQTETNSTPA